MTLSTIGFIFLFALISFMIFLFYSDIKRFKNYNRKGGKINGK